MSTSTPLIIGTNWEIDPSKEIASATYAKAWRGRRIEVTVSIGKALFGESKQYSTWAVYTNRVELSKFLTLNGFGSHCHVDEAELMYSCAADFMGANNLTLSRVQCTWPIAQILIADTTEQLHTKFHI